MLGISGWSANRATARAWHSLAEGRAETALPAQLHRRFHRHKGQRHEFGEAAGLRLQAPDAQEMPRPVPRCIDVAEHDGRGRAQADAVRGRDHVEPLRRRHFVRTDDRAHLIVENFRRCSRQRAETGGFQLGQEIRAAHPQCCRALRDFERREGVDVQVGHCRLDGLADRKVGLAGVVRMDAALQAGSTAPRSHASRQRRVISSSDRSYGRPRRLSWVLPLEKAQNAQRYKQTLV